MVFTVLIGLFVILMQEYLHRSISLPQFFTPKEYELARFIDVHTKGDPFVIFGDYDYLYFILDKRPDVLPWARFHRHQRVPWATSKTYSISERKTCHTSLSFRIILTRYFFRETSRGAFGVYRERIYCERVAADEGHSVCQKLSFGSSV